MAEHRSIRSATARLAWGIATIMTGLSCVATQAAASTPQPEGQILNANTPNSIAERYIAVLKEASTRSVPAAAEDLAGKYHATVHYLYRATVQGFSAEMSEQDARRMAADPSVAYVEQVQQVRLAGEQPSPPSWGIDRIDQPGLPLGNSYKYPDSAGSGVTVYVLDTGIRRTHQDFENRASFGYDFIDNDPDATDCHGHGTHVAGTAAGRTYGVAKAAKIVAVRVLNCQGSGNTDQIVAGIDWVTQNAAKPAVANMSLGLQGSDTTMENAVKGSIAAGIQYSLAAGNNGQDACGFSPAKVPTAITVGNTTNQDARNNGSNYGTCLDLFAPGTSIVSASYSSDTGSATMTGTSMAAPHVAGAAALYLSEHPSASSAEVRDALVNNGVTGKVTSPGSGSPNVLLNTAFLLGPSNPGEVKVANPGDQSSLVGTAVTLTNTVSGGTEPYTWSATGLPAGLSIDSGSGTVSGTPTAEGTSSVTITAKDSAGKSGSATFSWKVSKDGGTTPLSLANPGFQTSTVGKPVSLQMSATGGSGGNSWKATALPSGLIINARTGLISGTPTTFGSSNTVVTVTDSSGKSATAQFPWFVFGW